MTYNFSPKIQLVYGIFGFLLTLGILYILLNELNWIASIIVGIANFIISGFYNKINK